MEGCKVGTLAENGLIVIRRPNQDDLFDQTAPRYRYTAVASNRPESAAETLEWYA